MPWFPGNLIQPALTILLLLATMCAYVQGKHVSPESRLGCHIRGFAKEVALEPHVTENGDVIECFGKVPISVCYGLCESAEIGDYKMPYKIARHHVCTYERFEMKEVPLNCPGYPNPVAQVLDARSCRCQKCDSDYTSCQQLLV